MALQRYQHTGAAPQTNLAVSMMSTDTSFTAASGSNYPDGSVGLFVVVVDPGLASEEKILCSSRAGAVFTVSGGVAGRGYDGTSAVAHTAPTAVIEHIWSAAEADDTSRHIYATASVLSDDHTNYPLLTGARAFTGGVTINTGGLTVTAGGVTVSAGNVVASTGALSADLTGTAGRLVGASNAAPSSGTFVAGDIAPDSTNKVIQLCTTGGTPGTWSEIGTGLYRTRVYRTTSLTLQTLLGPNAAALIKMDGTQYDLTSSYSASTGKYTVPVAGYYEYYAQIGSNVGSANALAVSVFQNASGTPDAQAQEVGSGTFNAYATVKGELLCAANDTLAVYAWSGTGSPNVVTTSADTFFMVKRIG